MRVYQLLAGSFAVLTFTLVACSSPTEPSGLSQKSTKGDNDGDAKKEDPKKSTSSTTPSKTTQPTNSASSGGTTTVDVKACQAKCEATSADTKAAVAAERAIDKKYHECECAPTRCGNECKTDTCAANADPNAEAKDAACDACLAGDKTNDCDTQTKPDYEKNEATPGYQAYEQCTTAAKCEEDGGDDDDDDDDAAPAKP